jgi:hypothetical protein
MDARVVVLFEIKFGCGLSANYYGNVYKHDFSGHKLKILSNFTKPQKIDYKDGALF